MWHGGEARATVMSEELATTASVHTRGSALLGRVRDDAAFLADRIVTKRQGRVFLAREDSRE